MCTSRTRALTFQNFVRRSVCVSEQPSFAKCRFEWRGLLEMGWDAREGEDATCRLFNSRYSPRLFYQYYGSCILVSRGRNPEGVRNFLDRLKRCVFFKNWLKGNARPPWKLGGEYSPLTSDFLEITPSSLCAWARWNLHQGSTKFMPMYIIEFAVVAAIEFAQDVIINIRFKGTIVARIEIAP